MMKIAFITDGGLELGMGHVLQSTTLAKLLQDRAEICFLTKSDNKILDKIKEAGFPALQFNNDFEILKHLNLIKPSRIIIDKLDVDEDFAKQIRKDLKIKLAIFTNITKANKYANIAITADIGSQFENLKFVDENTKTLYFYGPKYWILREEFYQLKINKKIRQEVIRKILLIFGGSDPSNITSVVLNELLANEFECQIDVILGTSFAYMDCINDLLKKYESKSNNLNIHRNTKDVAKLMYKADLVMASPGLSCFEALCVGTPVIIIPQNDLQRATYEGFFSILNKDDVIKIRKKIEEKDFTYSDSEYVQKMEIGEGKRELIEEILSYNS